MDHHCPWTMNCIGHENLPHFLRFVGWLIFNSIIIIWKLSERAISYYQNSSLPSYLINKSEMVYVILFLPITTFLAITVLILYVRCIYNLGFKGMTQIEVWEWERVESQIRNGRIWKQIKINYRTLHGKELPRLVSWSKHSRYYEEDEGEEGGVGLEGEAERRDSLGSNDEATGVIDQSEMNDNHNLQPDFTIDDLIFPYDLGIWRNLTDACGSPFMWLLPFGSPRTLGYEFVKNEFIEDDQLGLPWPPDGGHQEGEVEDELDSIPLEDLSYEGRIRKINRLRDPRNELKRLEWMNDLGETLDDFGVDLEAEDTENDHLIAK